MQLSRCHYKSEFSYLMSGQVLNIVEQHSYLGVIIDHKLSWQPHVDYVCGKTMKLIGFLNCNLHTCSKALKELSYKQYVLPTLDYASSIWDPYHQNQINKLEMIQHRFVLNQLGGEMLGIVLVYCCHHSSGLTCNFGEKALV